MSEANSFAAVTLRQPCEKLPEILHPTTHTGHMNPKGPARSVWIFLAVFLAAAWIALIYLAITVTNTVVAMLEYVVELAQLY